MQAGTMRRRITIQQSSDVPDGSGGVQRTWTDFATVWAEITPAAGKEVFQAEQVRADAMYNINIRYLQGVSAEMRVLYGTRRFNIRAVNDVNEMHRKITLVCEELKSA